MSVSYTHLDVYKRQVERELVAACLQVHALLNAGVSFGIEFANYGVSPPAVVDAASTLLDLASLPARKLSLIHI